MGGGGEEDCDCGGVDCEGPEGRCVGGVGCQLRVFEIEVVRGAEEEYASSV